MRRIAVLLMAGLGLLVPAPAFADHGSYGRGGDNGSGNEREEDYEGANCKYVCPQFDRSPVRDAFNLHVCMPGATCHYDGRQDEQPPEEQQP
jgi:hypothetical protein